MADFSFFGPIMYRCRHHSTVLSYSDCSVVTPCFLFTTSMVLNLQLRKCFDRKVPLQIYFWKLVLSKWSMNFHFKIRLSRWLNIRKYIKSGPIFKKKCTKLHSTYFSTWKLWQTFLKLGPKKKYFPRFFS